MQLTPLHYYFEPHGGSPRYGNFIYTTDCGRFQISRCDILERPKGWMIDESWLKDINFDNWQAWLESIGLADVIFPTRREALSALNDALNADMLMDSVSASL